MAEPREAIVVGGGIAGLSCAVALAEHGVACTLLEASAELGGRARSWVDDKTGDTVDIGPHVLHSEYRNFPALLARCGTLGRVCWQPETVITIGPLALRHWRLPPPFSLLPDFLRSPGMTARDYVSNSRATWRAMKYGEEQVADLDRFDALDFLRRHGVSEPMIDWFWRFAGMAVMNVPLELCSAASLMRVHSQLIGHRGIHFGFPQAGLSELYVPQCVHRIETAGGRVLRNARVERLETREGMHTAIARGERFSAPTCVLAVPPRELEALRPGLADTRAFEPSPYISCYLWLDRKITRERFWGLPWAPERLNYDFYDLSNIRQGLRASLIASNIIFSHRAHGMSDEEIVEATRREIALHVPGPHNVIHARVHRIPMAIACPKPGTERARPAARTAAPGLYLAGDWTRTALPSSMESAACSGFLAAGEILGRPLALPTRPTEGLAGLVRRWSHRPRRRVDRLQDEREVGVVHHVPRMRR